VAQDADSATTVIEGCQHLRRSGKPQVQRYGSRLIWLALVPAGTYHSETELAGSSVLFRFMPLMQRPRGALRVPVAILPINMQNTTRATA
jgi:hypothetical protein